VSGLRGKEDAGIGQRDLETDVCVVGGGLAGLCAALAAARHGARVVLIQERPVLGGNSSSEIRMHICGADRYGELPNLRETGILEELRLENAYRNPQQSNTEWDAVLYDRAITQPGLTLLLNTTCQGASMEGSTIASVTAWQMTTNLNYVIRARLFVDCSGDGILAPLTGAEFRMGREGRDEFGESIAPEKPDPNTMGLSCMFMAREYDAPQPFEPYPWAYVFERDEDLPYGAQDHDWFRWGYWWIELGGDRDSLYGAEELRDELLRIVYGVWDHIKNRGDHGADNWALEWVQFLPGKRESRRYVGDYMLSQRDIEAGGVFADAVAYGGWTMDDHHPAGFWAVKLGKPATIFHSAPSPYGIPYRSLYARDIVNLMFAGRCASCTHAAMSSTRVMGTAASMGQAVGTAAAIAIHDGLTPRQVGDRRIRQLQQALLDDDAYIPGLRRELSVINAAASLTASRGDPEPLRDGISRPVGTDGHFWLARPGDWAAYTFSQPLHLKRLTLVLDSALDRLMPGVSHYPLREGQLLTVPPVMPKVVRVDGLCSGQWQPFWRSDNNHQRLLRVPIDREFSGVRLTIEATWGAPETRVFGFYVD